MPALPFTQRLAASCVALACLALLCVSAWLTPSASGFGTHEQIRLRSGVGLQPCTWVTLTGKPCPTCGMTTAFAFAAEGDLVSSFKAQPLGALLALATSLGFWIALHIAWTGSRLGVAVGNAMGARALWIGLGLLAASWVYKVITWPASAP